MDTEILSLSKGIGVLSDVVMPADVCKRVGGKKTGGEIPRLKRESLKIEFAYVCVKN